MNKEWLSLILFVLCYVLFVIFPHRRSWVACGGSLLLILFGALTWNDALFSKVSWNVMGLFFGTLILAELFMLSRVPAIMAEWLVNKAPTARVAMLLLCVLSGLISAFVENVAVVLLVAPVALSLADKIKINPVPLLIGIAISSNLQGTATMIGDPPSMILAGYMKLSFFDFFFYNGRPGIFFAVEIGCAVSLVVLWFAFRHQKNPISVIAEEKVKSMIPTILLVLLMAGLSIATLFDPDFKWFAGVLTLVLAVVALMWYLFIAKWGTAKELFKTLDWDTTFFLIGVFILVGALSDSGWIDRLTGFLAASVGSNRLLAFIVIVMISMIVSGFVDNVPFLLAMIPVADKLAQSMNAPVPFLMFGLLIGTCLGGNLTPIGASANVVAIGILKKRGYTVKFREFMGIGIPFTVAAVVAACLFVWLIWAPK